MKTLYMIVNPVGKFSTGGMLPRFNTSGKAWTEYRHLTNHLAKVKLFPYARGAYRDCKIVKFGASPCKPEENELFKSLLKDFQ